MKSSEGLSDRDTAFHSHDTYIIPVKDKKINKNKYYLGKIFK